MDSRGIDENGAAAMTITVLYIGGVGRSGSSLLERLLDKHDDVISLGEIHQIFSNWMTFDKRQLCGCTEQFQNCDFWREVMARSIGTMDDFDPAVWREQRSDVLTDNHWKHLATGRASKTYLEKLDSFLEPIGAFYRAIAEVSGARVIVDSSKTTTWALALQRIPGIEVRFLHFVRNPYATAYSWQRKKVVPEVWWEERHMPIFSASEIGHRWRSTYWKARLAARRFTRYSRLHYEDFVRSPADKLNQIIAFAGLSPLPPERGIVNGHAAIPPGHTIMGNPMRVQREVTVREDDEWRNRLSAEDHAAVKRYVWPLRPFYRP